jgi:hypothetical protein
MTKEHLEIHLITNISFDDRPLSISAFPGVWQTYVDRFLNVIALFISFLAQHPVWTDVIGFSLSQSKVLGKT